MKRADRLVLLLALFAQLAGNTAIAPACTGITVRPKDGSVVYARTMEFAADFQSNIVVIPRGLQLTGSTPSSVPGLRWTTKLGVVGANGFNMPVTLDGLNESGLAVGLFYFPGFARYEHVKPRDLDNSLAPWELGVYLLSTCADVHEALAAVNRIHVAEVTQKDMGFVPPLHYLVSDARGNCAVLEPIDGQIKIHANPLGVLTNSPSFDWHLTNLSNYLNVAAGNAPPIEVDGLKISSLGQGSGMLGLPGDFTSPSRFVRAVAFTRTALPVETAREGVLQAFHILNQFDIPKGAARGMDHGQPVADYTLWTSAADLTNRQYYFRTFDNSRIRKVDLQALHFDAPAMKTILMQGNEQIEDVSHQAR